VGSGKDSAPNIAIFVDFENVAIGAQQAKYESFDVSLVLERLLDKGNIIVKKAYADWERYKPARRALHEAAFELIEIPHVSYSGKNSADIRLVVDALDLCYTKGHVDVFVIVSGDSDFSPLVAKLRENNKTVVGLGVKNSSSDLLIDNCDEFIYYDELIRNRAAGAQGRTRSPSAHPETHKREPRGSKEPRSLDAKVVRGSEGQRAATANAGRPVHKVSAAPSTTAGPAAAAASAAPGAASSVTSASAGPATGNSAATPSVATTQPNVRDPEDEERLKLAALEMVLDIVDALFRERDDNLWASQVKQTLKRKKPQFSETFHGYRNFTELLEDARRRELLEIQKDVKSGGYLILSFGKNA
jgi:uncharacterized protein (TIGR00288 family)